MRATVVFAPLSIWRVIFALSFSVSIFSHEVYSIAPPRKAVWPASYREILGPDAAGDTQNGSPGRRGSAAKGCIVHRKEQIVNNGKSVCPAAPAPLRFLWTLLRRRHGGSA